MICFTCLSGIGLIKFIPTIERIPLATLITKTLLLSGLSFDAWHTKIELDRSSESMTMNDTIARHKLWMNMTSDILNVVSTILECMSFFAGDSAIFLKRSVTILETTDAGLRLYKSYYGEKHQSMAAAAA